MVWHSLYCWVDDERSVSMVHSLFHFNNEMEMNDTKKHMFVVHINCVRTVKTYCVLWWIIKKCVGFLFFLYHLIRLWSGLWTMPPTHHNDHHDHQHHLKFLNVWLIVKLGMGLYMCTFITTFLESIINIDCHEMHTFQFNRRINLLFMVQVSFFSCRLAEYLHFVWFVLMRCCNSPPAHDAMHAPNLINGNIHIAH